MKKINLLLIGFAFIANYAGAQTYNVPNNGALSTNPPLVGIGTITPASTIHVRTPQLNNICENVAQFEVSDAITSGNSAYIKIINGTGANGIFYPVLDATANGNGSNGSYPSLCIRANGYALQDNIFGKPLMIFRSTTNYGVVAMRPLFQWQQGDGSAKMTMDPAGKLGIGTAYPTEKLDVAGNIRLNYNQIYLTADNNHGLGYYNNNFATSGPYLNKTIDGPVLYGYSGGALGTNSDGVKNIALNWQANGNVGIGSDLASNTYNGTANYFKLSVNGSIRAKEIIVNTNWADFVFDKNYKLNPLSDLEQYINANGHLPEIPAASEIETNGGNLGELVKLQMQKIEELTLYVIEQNKKLAELNTAVQTQHNQIEFLEKK